MNASHEPSAFQSRLLQGTRYAACLVAIQCVVLSMVAWYAHMQHGQYGSFGAAVACLVCLVPAIAGIYAVALTAGSMTATAMVFGAMGLRMAVALFAINFMPHVIKPLAEVGFLGMVLINYFVVLVFETIFSVLLMQAFEPSPVGQ